MKPFFQKAYRLNLFWYVLAFVIGFALLLVAVAGLPSDRERGSIHPPEQLRITEPKRLNEVMFREFMSERAYSLSLLQGALFSLSTGISDPANSFDSLGNELQSIQQRVASEIQNIGSVRIPGHTEQYRSYILGQLTDLEVKLVNTRAVFATGNIELIGEMMNELQRTLGHIVSSMHQTNFDNPIQQTSF